MPPAVLLMGARRAGKSSIQKVVFHKMSPHETLFIEATNKIVKNGIANSSFVQFEVWDFPGHVDTSSAAVKPETTYGGCGALVWVIDAQDDHAEAIARLQATIVTAHRINPNIVFEVFIHKVDSLSDDQRIECQREIQNQLTDELATARVQHARINFHLTSIYDHSVFEAFSKVPGPHPARTPPAPRPRRARAAPAPRAPLAVSHRPPPPHHTGRAAADPAAADAPVPPRCARHLVPHRQGLPLRRRLQDLRRHRLVPRRHAVV
jgi:hypothetical protein